MSRADFLPELLRNGADLLLLAAHEAWQVALRGGLSMTDGVDSLRRATREGKSISKPNTMSFGTLAAKSVYRQDHETS